MSFVKETNPLSLDTNHINFLQPTQNMHTINKVNYPVRIHRADYCNCKRIKTKMAQAKLKPGQKIVYIIEKLWNDEKYKHFPATIFITDDCNNDNSSNAKLTLQLLFHDSLFSRGLVNKYFKQYQWSFQKSKNIRSIVKSIPTICFCRDDLIVDKTTCNSGFIIVGTEEQMKSISHCFNKYCQKTEYSKAYILKLSNIHMVHKDQLGYNMEVFAKSKERKLLGPSFYTLVGEEMKLENSSSDNPTYTFPFGKREWFYETDETSLECAKRELYEELNIQFSTNLWTQSQTTNHPKYIHRPNDGLILYFLYLPQITTVKYHEDSDTIYLDC